MAFETIEIAGQEAVELLHRYRDEHPATGKYPFLIGPPGEGERLREGAESYPRSVTEIVRESAGVDLEAFFEQRRLQESEDGPDEEELVGRWPGEIPEKGRIRQHQDDLSGKAHPLALLGLAAIDSPWQLPAAVKFGGWNENPFPEVHCALLRSWQQEYGAEIASLSTDVMECLVARPPQTPEAALALAWQQYHYCSDVVLQGVQTVSNLAGTLLNSEYWYFWWD